MELLCQTTEHRLKKANLGFKLKIEKKFFYFSGNNSLLGLCDYHCVPNSLVNKDLQSIYVAAQQIIFELLLPLVRPFVGCYSSMFHFREKILGAVWKLFL